jgi:hypothetical protein
VPYCPTVPHEKSNAKPISVFCVLFAKQRLRRRGFWKDHAPTATDHEFPNLQIMEKNMTDQSLGRPGRGNPQAPPGQTVVPQRSPAVAAFLDQLKAKAPARPEGGRGRLIFALDGTASREPTWDSACKIQGEMFEATAALGGLDLQLVYYRGFDECKASRWLSSAADLHRVMRSVSCVGGETQIERVLTHTIRETGTRKVSAVVFVGDAMEEKVDRLCRLAGELGALGVPIFVFQEGDLPDAEVAFRQMATLSKGAYCRFDLGAIGRLKGLLAAVAVYATGGRDALLAYGQKKGGEALRLTSQLRR